MRWMLALLLVATAAAADDELDAAFERDVLIISASAHACYRFDIYLALDVEQKRRGLMHVRSLPATTGMLFVYDGRYHQSMWMKNTLIFSPRAAAWTISAIPIEARSPSPW